MLLESCILTVSESGPLSVSLTDLQVTEQFEA